MNRMSDQLTFSDQSAGQPVLQGAVQPATGWDETTQSAVNGLNGDENGDGVSDSVTSLDGVETF